MHRRFFSLKMRDDQSILSWIADVHHLGYLLKQAGYPLTDVDKVLALTQGLPASYTTLLVTLDGLHEPTFEDVTVRLLTEETLQKFASAPAAADAAPPANTPTSIKSEDDVFNDALAAFTTFHKAGAKKLGKIYCHRCGGIGHVRAQCPSIPDNPDACRIIATAAIAMDDSDSDGEYFNSLPTFFASGVAYACPSSLSAKRRSFTATGSLSHTVKLRHIGNVTGLQSWQQSGKEEHAAGEAEYKAAQAKGWVEGTADRIEGKKDSIVGAVTGDKTQQAQGNMQHDKGQAQQEINK
ncbi:putative Hmp1-mismatch base pair and cruciform DNA recognition protein [Mycena sanguinolenta]|uniref:Putative Hmp1-mismatch base pair and cruciform DNA recognition protein n=1 Tax=Mycena sanguinolenta TaxID=230812 RepID=A0A8H7CNX5_9AGAR|nr:putative Hmp1-mismatch base pair and cruciform DNA recognition protein [Mycena sanguinolenta]